ncbi:MAG: hypothetical protein ABI790_13970 [Betaproteobacteria bacterium]
MTEIVKAWQCIGCGKIEAPQQCVGVCQDRKIEMVYVQDHHAALAHTLSRVDALESVLRQIVATTPRNEEWERSYRALQERARHALNNAT